MPTHGTLWEVITSQNHTIEEIAMAKKSKKYLAAKIDSKAYSVEGYRISKETDLSNLMHL